MDGRLREKAGASGGCGRGRGWCCPTRHFEAAVSVRVPASVGECTRETRAATRHSHCYRLKMMENMRIVLLWQTRSRRMPASVSLRSLNWPLLMASGFGAACLYVGTGAWGSALIAD
jgi:hypothetical protein